MSSGSSHLKNHSSCASSDVAINILSRRVLELKRQTTHWLVRILKRHNYWRSACHITRTDTFWRPSFHLWYLHDIAWTVNYTSCDFEAVVYNNMNCERQKSTDIYAMVFSEVFVWNNICFHTQVNVYKCNTQVAMLTIELHSILVLCIIPSRL